MKRLNLSIEIFKVFACVLIILLSGSLILGGIVYATEKPEVFVQLGHSNSALAVAFSPDGKYALSGSVDNTMKLWEVSTGREVKTFRGHTNYVNSVTFSPDGRYALSGSGDKSLKLWKVSTGREMKTFRGHTDYVVSVAFSPDGRYALSGSKDNSLILWKVSTGRRVKTFRGQKYISSVIFTPDGKYALSGSRDNTLKFWDISTGREMRSFKCSKVPDNFLRAHPASYINSVAITPDGNYALSVSGDSTLKLWNIATGRETRVFTERVNSCNSIALSPDGRYVLSGGGGETSADLKLWEVSTGRVVRSFKGHSDLINSIAVSPEGKYILSGSRNGVMRLWNRSTGRVVRSFKSHSRIGSVAFSPDGRYVLSDSENYTLKLREISTGKEVRTFRGHSDFVGYIAFSPDGRYALSVSRDNTLKLWDIQTGKTKATKKNIGPIRSVVFSPDGKRALLGGGGWKATLWLLDMRTGKRIRTFTGHTRGIHSVAISPDGRYALSGGDDYTLKLWDIATGREIRTFKGHSWVVNSVAFSPDGRYALSGSGDYTLKLWDISTGSEIRTFKGHTYYIFSVAFSPDGRYALSGSWDGTIRMWNVNTGTEIAMMVGFKNGDWATITRDGYFVASKNGAEHINVTIGLKSYTIDNFFEKFYNPEIVAKVMSGEQVKVASDIRNLTSTPPEVKIINPKHGAILARRNIIITVQAIDTGGGIDEIRLYQNLKLISEEQRGVAITPKKGHGITKRYNVILLPGTNEFRAIALNRDRTESNPAIIEIHSKAVHASADLYILAIGINEYKNPRYNLNYSKSDAEAFVNAVEQRSRGIFKHIYKQLVFDNQATRNSIEAAFKQIMAKAGPDDGFLLYYAGHGVMSEGDRNTPPDFYIAPYDVTRLYGHDDMLKSKGISAKRMKELCTKIKAQKQLIILDACQSGGAIESFALRGAAEEKAILQLARSAGVVVMAATGTEQFATEFKALGQGVFTYALLKGLEGEADGGSPPDRKITVKELEAYINDKVPELTEKYRGTAQYPNSFSQGQDFPLSIVK